MRYLFFVMNLGGCILGESDYSFSCIINADNQRKAEQWAIVIATRYSQKFGFAPHNLKISPQEITHNIFFVETRDEQEEINQMECPVANYGEIPAFLADIPFDDQK
jgi:hypothetical protein